MQPQHGTTETHSNWAVAERLRALLEKDGYRVVMTKRAERQKVPNVRRADIANRAHAALMLRLHCDTGGGSGFRVFYPDTSARDGKVVGPSEEVQRESKEAAEAIHAGLADTLGDALHDNGIATDRATAVGRRMGGALIGSIHSKAPVVLVEMVFLSNAADAEFIKSADGQEKLARGLEAGVRRYVKPGG